MYLIFSFPKLNRSRAWNASSVVHQTKPVSPNNIDDGSFGLGLGFVRGARFQSATQHSSPRSSPRGGAQSKHTSPPMSPSAVLAAASAVIVDEGSERPASSRYTAQIEDVSPSELAGSEQGVITQLSQTDGDDWAKFD